MILMPLICHLATWRLDRTQFGFADRSRAELQELVPQLDIKKPRVEEHSPRVTRSQKPEDAAHKEK